MLTHDGGILKIPGTAELALKAELTAVVSSSAGGCSLEWLVSMAAA
jgi:hypothetical protein